MNFNAKLQTLRKQSNLSQEQLAQKLNVSRQAVSKWETGEGYPELDKLVQISNIFDVSLDYLIKDKETENKDYLEKTADRQLNIEFTDLSEIEDYVEMRNHLGKNIAIGVMIIICSIILPIIMEDTHFEDIAGGIMLIIMGIGIGLLVMTGIRFNQLEKPELMISSTDYTYLLAEFDGFKSIIARNISIGVFLCLLGVGMTIIFDDESIGVSLMFLLIAVAVYLFITTGIEYATHKIVIGQKEFKDNNIYKEPGHKRKRIPLIENSVIVYLILGFVFHLWHPGWLIFPIFAILDNVIND